MKISPVRSYREPGLPTRVIVDEHPELLEVLPERWRGNPTVIAALTGLCLMASGHRSVAGDKLAPGSAPRIAPIFQHGDGKGSFGCVSVSPAVFLSEDEARQVVIEEAKRSGLDLSGAGPVVSGVSLPNYGVPPVNGKPRTEPLKLDGLDAKRRVAFEFVSMMDTREWSEPSGSTVESWDFRHKAMDIRDALSKNKPAYTVGVFYEPYAMPTGQAAYVKDASGKVDWDATKRFMKKFDAEQLRAQVRDFIKWLKAEGVI